MNRIVCEVCGSSDLVKDDELFVCSHCGAKYSTEAVKQMITGTVVIDRTGEVSNLLSLAHSAIRASNTSEANSYASRVLEIDPQNSEAWMVKGRAVGWSSSLKNFRLAEMISAFSTAIELAEPGSRDAARRECAEHMNRIAVAVHTMSWKHVNQYAGVAGAWQEHITRCESFVSVWELTNSWNGAREPLDSIIFVVSNLITGIKFRGFRGESRVVFLQPAYEAKMRQVLEGTAAKLRAFDPGYATPAPKKLRAGLF